MDINNLIEKGFSSRQISQISFIDDLGFDLSNISADVSVETLKDFKNNLEEDKFSPKHIKDLKNFIDNNDNIDVTNLLKINFNTDNLTYLEWFVKNGYNISKISELGNGREKLSYLKYIYEKTNKAYNYLEELNVTPLDLEYLYSMIDDYNVRKYLDIIPDSERFLLFNKTAYEIKSTDKKIPDLSILFSNKYNIEQVREIAIGIQSGANPIDIKKYCDEEFTPAQIEVICYGLAQKLDVTFFNKKEYSARQMDSICTYLSIIEDGESFDINQICDVKYSAYCMEFLGERLRAHEDISVYTKYNYDVNQMNVLYMGIRNNIDISKYEDISLSGRDMYLIYNALKLDPDGKNIDINYLKSDIPTTQKVNYLVQYCLSKYNLKNINKLDIKLNNRMAEINDYYCNDYDEDWYGEDNSVYFETDDDKIIVLDQKETFDYPNSVSEIIKTDEDHDFNAVFVNNYTPMLEEIFKIICFIEFGDKVKSVNLYLDEELYYIDFAFDEKDDVEDIINTIVEETLDTLMNENYYSKIYRPLFYNLNDFNDCGIINLDDISWKYDLNLFGDFTFVFEEDLFDDDSEITDENIKEKYEKFMKDSELLYAYYAEDVKLAKLYDKDFNLLKEETIYGTYKIEDKLSKLFNVNIIGIMENLDDDIDRDEDDFDFEEVEKD